MKRPHHRIATGAALVALALAFPVAAQDANKVATVNGKDIPKARADLLARQASQQGQADSPQLRQQIREELVNRELLSQEAERRGVGKTGEIREQLELARQQVVIQAFLQDWAKTNPVTDEQLRGEYEKIKAQMGGNEYKARHILVETEAEAKDIAAKLKKGEKFEELAKASKDPGSKENGGDLGWNTPQTFVKPFSDTMVKLKKGETAEPVQTQFGWHVIRLDDTRAVKHPPFDEVKPQVTQRLQRQMLEKLVADLRAKAKIQ
jgi:peptidyl-prolyl cis-trans isomerase C